MTTWVALLRGVNVGGRNMVAMAELRKLCARIGLEEAQTLLQSGNVVFRCPERDGGALETRLEQELRKRLGFAPAVFVRNADEWASLVKRNPFREEAERDPAHLVAVLMREAPKPAAIAALRAAIPGREQVDARGGREAYFFYPDGMGRSKLTPAIVDKHLGGSGTARNWNTVLKLLALTRNSRA